MHVGFGERRGETCIIQDTRRPAPILQKVDSERKLDDEAQAAIRQIHDKRYFHGMRGEVILAGVAFCGKIPKVVTETIIVR